MISGFVPGQGKVGRKLERGIMTDRKTGREDVNERLHKAIAGLRSNITRVEIWATALFTFSQPIPGYEPDPRYELGQPVKSGRMGQNGEPEPVKEAAEEPSK